MTSGCSVAPFALRARIAGAVIRLPGTGEGVARLVEVSMVKVDMGRLLTPMLLRSKTRRMHSPEQFGLSCDLLTVAEPRFPTGAFSQRNRIEHGRALIAQDRE